MIQLFAWLLTSKVRHLTGQGIHKSLLPCTRTWIKLEILEQQFALQRFFKRKGRIYIRHCSVHVSCRLPRLPGVWFAIAKIWCAIFTRLDSTCNFSGLFRISSSVLWKASQHHHVPLMVSHWRSLTWCYLLSRAIKLDLLKLMICVIIGIESKLRLSSSLCVNFCVQYTT